MIRFLEPMTVGVLSNRRLIGPYGMAGGEPGQVGKNQLIRKGGNIEELSGVAVVEVNAGDAFLDMKSESLYDNSSQAECIQVSQNASTVWDDYCG